jgi:hypothetical protein
MRHRRTNFHDRVDPVRFLQKALGTGDAELVFLHPM